MASCSLPEIEGLPFFDEIMGGFKVDESLLQHYFTFQYVPEPKTITPQISVLEASHYMKADAEGKVDIKRYLDLKFQTPSEESFEEKAKSSAKSSPSRWNTT